MKASKVRVVGAVIAGFAVLAVALRVFVMYEASEGSEKPQRKIVLQTPATVGAFATAAGLDINEVVEELRKIGIHARANFVMPKDVLQTLGTKHRLEVEFTRASKI